MLATEVIKKKREKSPLSLEELDFFISGYTQDHIPDYQMSSLLMAIFLNGMTEAETADLTQVMLDSGQKVGFPNSFPVDKHSTGGVGDKTSLILAPIVAACGVPVPMMSGRGLGHTGGTLDKLEAIPGFDVHVDLDRFKKIVDRLQLCFIGQTKNICPADKKIYALRDVTATVESLPLICASIMSKKIAEGIKGLVLDVKFGSGAFMKTLPDAKALALGLSSIGKKHGLKVTALLTNMNQPLGHFVGNSLEVMECLSIMKRESFSGYNYKDFGDTEDLSVALAAEMIATGKSISLDEAKTEALEALNSGKAFEKFKEVCRLQGGDLEKIKVSETLVEVKATQPGFFSQVNSEQIGVAGIEIQAGRKKVDDQINPTTGIEVIKKVGDPVTKGETLFKIYCDSQKQGVEAATGLLNSCYKLTEQAPEMTSLIAERIQ